jgi:hypothetical protein
LEDEVGRVTAWTLALLATLLDVRATHAVVDAASGEEWTAPGVRVLT